MTTGRYKSGREPFEVIEIDQDFCDHEYGDSSCGATLSDGLSKCYNTIGTCQAVPNFQAGILTLKFCTDTPSMPNDGGLYFPFLVGSPKVKPAEINPGGAKRTSTALGKRATISVKLSDHPWNDKVVDKYWDERVTGEAQADGVGYNPAERSTFWRKWKARNLYYLNRPLRYISGYIENGQLVDAVTRYFVITGFSGPDKNGGVTIEGQDVLYLAQREKAEAPQATSGKLVSDISDTDTSFTLNPVGIGDAQYPASGFGRFGSEVIEYVRSGDTFTVTTDGRGAYNTVASSHSSGDAFQACWVVDSKRPDEILYEVLNEYSEIDASLLDTAQWDTEALDFLPTLYSGIVTEPTSVADIIAEMCEQMYFYAWFDERANKVKIRAVRPSADDTVYQLDEASNIVSGSISVKDDPDQVITRVVINYAPSDPTRGLDEVSNYRVTDIFGDLAEEGEDRNRGSRTKVINSRWLQGGSAAAAEDLGERLLARYKVPPRVITWQMDAKDRDVWVADFASITTYQIADQNGLNPPVPCQVLSASESQAGTTFTYSAQQFQFELPPAPNISPLTPSTNENNLNLRDWYDDNYGDTPTSGMIVTATIRPGVIVGSTDATSFPALEVGTWPAGVILTLVVEPGAYVVGKGGAGGAGDIGFGASDGAPGGLAILANGPIIINNLGVIGGGGGGGAGGLAGVFSTSSGLRVYGGGGGGAGAGQTSSSGGAGGNVIGTADGVAGGPSSHDTPGAGGAGGRPVATAVGGDGGGLGESGLVNHGSNVGGAAGAAIDGISNVTWINRGDVRGAEI